jgi:hypothetical protein
VPPRIYFYGKPVTNTTQTVALGQLIQLTTAPTQSGQTQSWTVSGDLVGGYTASGNYKNSKAVGTGTVSDADFTQSSTNFYWIAPGTQTVTYKVQYPGGHPETAKATFKVVGPAHAKLEPDPGDVQVFSPSLFLWDIGLGNALGPIKTPGITFAETGNTVTPQQPGQYQFVQLIMEDSLEMTPIGGSVVKCSTLPPTKARGSIPSIRTNPMLPDLRRTLRAGRCR